jgi:hypothetical protein
VADDDEVAREELAKVKAEVEETAAKITHTFHLAIGRAITIWSRMEGSLVHIAAWILDSRVNKVGLVFYSINNFHTWLSIIDELFAIDPNYIPLRTKWTKIQSRLIKLNDVRVRLAHHALEKGADLSQITEENYAEIVDDNFDPFPSLRPNRLDTRAKWKKKSVDLEELTTFKEQLLDTIEEMGELMKLMGPIHLGPKRKLLAKIKALQEKAGEIVPSPRPALPTEDPRST